VNAIRKIIRADGTEIGLDAAVSIVQACKLIGAETLDTVMLADRVHVMLVDDNGYERDLPVNQKATALYLKRCRTGTTHEIVGDVVIVPDSDFGGVA